MNLSKIGILGAGLYGSSKIIESRMSQYNSQVLEPIDTISIIMPSYNEIQFIETALNSLRNQSIIQEYPQYFELLVADSCSTDGTIEKVESIFDSEHNLNKRFIIVPRGKLKARNIATDQAKGNIIVAVDADCYYPYHWLNTLLTPFNDYKNNNYANVIGTFGSTFDYSMPNIPNSLFILGDNFVNYLLRRNRTTGRNSGYYKHVHYMAGGFNESVDQFDIWNIWKEEEKLFGDRLSKFGRIIYNISASCYHLGGKKSLKRLIDNSYKKERDTF